MGLADKQAFLRDLEERLGKFVLRTISRRSWPRSEILSMTIASAAALTLEKIQHPGNC